MSAEVRTEPPPPTLVLFHAATEAMVLSRLHDGRIVDVNEAFCELCGFPREDLLGKTAAEIGILLNEAQGDAPASDPKVDMVHASGTFRRGSGEIRDFVSSSRAIEVDGEPFMLSTPRDVTEERRAQRALVASEERYRALAEVTSEGVALHAEGRILEVNGALAKMLGYEAEEMIGRNSADFVEPASLPPADASAPGLDRPYEVVAIRRDGSTLPVEIQGRDLQYGGRRVRVTLVRDISERAAARQARRDHQARLEALVGSTDEIVFEFDRDMTYLQVFARDEELLSRPAEELLGHRVSEFVDADSLRPFREAVTRVLDTGEPESLEYAFEPRGGPRWFQARISRIGETGTAAFIARDVTSWHHTHGALRAAEESARMIFRQSPVAIWVLDLETYRFLDVNEACERQYGYTRAELLSMTALDIRPAEERERLRATIENAGPEVRNFGLWRHRRKDGSLLDVEVHSSEIMFEGRRARISLSIDVTEKLRAERALREAEERYRSLVETIPAVIFRDRIDEKSSSLYISPQVERLLGYPADEWQRDPVFWQRIVHPEDRDRVLADLGERVRRPEPYMSEYRLVAKDGRSVWVFEQATPVFDEEGRPDHWQGVWLDVTDRKNVEDALREAEERYRSLVETIPVAVYLDRLDEMSTSIYISPQAEEMLGYRPAEFQTNPSLWIDMLHPDDRDRVITGSERHRLANRDWSGEYRLIAKDGRVVWVHDEAVVVRDAGGEPLYWQGFWLDITERRLAEDALRKSEARYRMVVENASDLIALIAPDTTVAYASPSHRDVLGCELDDIVGKSAFVYDDGAVAEVARETFRKVVREGVPAGPQRFQLRHRDGHWLELEGSAWQPIYDDRGKLNLVLVVARDISERLRAEAQRREFLARLVAAQEEERHRIAGDVHDDPVQAMTAAALRLSMFRQYVTDDRGRAELEKLEASVNRAVTRLRHMLFDLHPRALDQDGLVAAIREYLRRFTEEDQPSLSFRIKSELDTEPPPDRRLILYRIAQEAVVNVRKHARARQVTVSVESRDAGVALRVEDDGVGPPEPEAADRRTHIGLSAMKERAELAGGWWRMLPREGGGTVVECWIPVPPAGA